MNKYWENLEKRQIWKSFVAYPAAAFVLLQAVEFFSNHLGLNPKFLTLSMILLIGGFVVSVIWNWNHGEKGIQKITTLEKSAYGIAIILTVFSGAYYWTHSQSNTRPEASDKEYSFNKLAVLPFENRSSDSSLVYLSDGIPENLINRIAKSTDMQVLSRNSTFILDESERNSEDVKEKLGADLMLSGRVDKVGNKLVVNCQLINLWEGVQIWGEKVYYENGNVVELEEQIVASLIRTFPNSMERESGKFTVEGPVNPEAKVHYMKGRALSYGSTQQEAERALDHFREAIEIDPGFAPAYVAIANEKIIQAMFSTASREEIFNEARTAVQTALALDPNSAEAFYVDGAIKFYGEFDWDAAEESYKKSIEINPGNANAYIRYSAFLAAMKRFDESIVLADKAISLDPISISSLHNLGWVHLLASNFEESESAFSEALDLHPNWIWGYAKRGYARMFQGKCELAQADAARARELIGEWSSELLESVFIFIYSRCGNEQKRSELTERFFARVNEDNYKDPFAVFFVYYMNGDLETALDWAERSLSEKEANCYLFNAEVFYNEDLKNHPRFIQIRKTLKFED